MDTINFSHKHITRPTITHADKVMNAIKTSPAPMAQRRCGRKHKPRRVAAAQSAPKSTTPTTNTRSKTKADTPPATRMRASTKNLGSAAAVTKMNNTVRKYAWGLTKNMEQIENKVH